MRTRRQAAGSDAASPGLKTPVSLTKTEKHGKRKLAATTPVSSRKGLASPKRSSRKSLPPPAEDTDGPAEDSTELPEATGAEERKLEDLASMEDNADSQSYESGEGGESSDGEGGSDDEAPEEVSLAAGRQAVAEASARELEAALTSAKKPKKQNAATSVAVGKSADAEDILPDHVIQILSQSGGHDEHAEEPTELSDQKRTRKRRRKAKVTVIEKGPIQVAVLGADRAAVSDGAVSFLRDRLESRHKRSSTMLLDRNTLRNIGPALKFV